MGEPPILPHDPGCIFFRIVAGLIPCHKLYENDTLLCFLDIGPVVPGHTLVVPKSHYHNVFDVPAELLGHLGQFLPAVAKAVTAAVEAPACHILLNNGSEAMQSVLHLHYHIIPRKHGDTFYVPWRPGRLDVDTARDLIVRIAKRLES